MSKTIIAANSILKQPNLFSNKEIIEYVENIIKSKALGSLALSISVLKE